MSLSAPPNQPPPLTLKQRLAHEAWHWADLPWQRFALLVLPIGLLVFLAPPLPVVAYALWLWASSSWAWRDRWASIWALARRGGVFVGLVLLVAALSRAQVWIFPDMIATLQAFWRAHLPGDLSLIPLFAPSLLARMLLLLPLAPALALYYEWVDPRTRVQQQRVLTARDLEPKQPKAKPDAPPTAPKEPTARAKPKPKQTAKAKQHRESPPPPEQITIEGFLASDVNQTQARPAPPSHQGTNKQPEPAPQAETPAPAPSKKIDWNNVAE